MTGTVWFMVKLVAGQYGAYFVDCSSMFSKANLKLWCRDGLHLSENQGLPLLLKRVHTATVSLLYEARATANPAGNMFIHIISQTDSPLRYQIFILQVLNSSLKEPKLIKDEVDPAEKTKLLTTLIMVRRTVHLAILKLMHPLIEQLLKCLMRLFLK